MEIQSSPFEVLLRRFYPACGHTAVFAINEAKFVCADPLFLPSLPLKEHYKPMNFV
jgi:hypothetical protein